MYNIHALSVPLTSVVSLAVALAVVLLLQEVMFVHAVGRKRRSADAESGESTFEPVPPGEDSLVPPCLSALRVSDLSGFSQKFVQGIGWGLRTISPRDHIGGFLPRRQIS